MSGESSNADEWSSLLEPVHRPEDIFRRSDDPRLGEAIETWQGDPSALRRGRAVLIGFPQDEGIRRNHGRAGAAEAPHEIRHWLNRLTPWDGVDDVDLTIDPPLDLGNVRLGANLEASQRTLGEVVAGVLRSGAVPIVLGGGHETAYGHYLGYIGAGLPVGIVNIDAHLDVRPFVDGRGHSGTPFRQAIEHPTHPLPGERYCCIGAQPHAVSRQHWGYAREQGCIVKWRDDLDGLTSSHFAEVAQRLAKAGCSVYLSIDADVVCTADVPGVSAPNPTGLSGREVIAAVRVAGRTPSVFSLDLVEINPRLDRDGQSARWGALLIWNFLIGLRSRPAPGG